MLVSEDAHDYNLAAGLPHDRLTQIFNHEVPDLELMLAQNPSAPPQLTPMHVNKPLGLPFDKSEINDW